MKIVKTAIITCFATITICAIPLNISAEEYTFSFDDSGISSVEQSLDELVESLPEELRDELDGISVDDIQGTTEKLREKLSIGEWVGRIFAQIKEFLPDILPSFLPMISLILLIAGVQAILPESQALKEAFVQFSSLFAAVEVFRLTTTVVEITQNYLENLCKVMNYFVPVIETVCLMGGKITEKAVSGGGILLLVTLIGNFNNIVLVPLTYLLFALTCVTQACGEVKLGGIVGGVRKFVMRLWSIMGILFSFLLGIQTVLAKSADNLATRTAKFAIGSFIPVAGGMLSEAFSTVQEGLSFVRQAAGIGGILLILAILLPGIIPLALYKLALSLCTSLAELLGTTSVAGLFAEIRGIIEFLLAVVLVTALLFLLALILFTKTNVG